MQTESWLDEELGDMFQAITETTETEFEVEGSINEIEHASRDGFFPFTNGGVSFVAALDLAYVVGTGKSFIDTKVMESIDATVANCYTDSRKHFIANNRAELDELFEQEALNTNDEGINYHILYELKQGNLAEILSETENEWLEGTLFIEHRAQFYSATNSHNETGEDEICFLSGVNLDYEYGRDKGLVYTYNETFKVKDLTPTVLETILKSMLQSI
jgi:hypothetical protein